jgi:hypothetical protein
LTPLEAEVLAEEVRMASIDRPERMKRLIRQWRASGQTKAEFVRRHGLSRGKLEYWVRQLDGPTGGRGGRVREPVNLIPVRLSDQTVADPAEAIEILLGSGDRVRVSPEVPAEALRRVIEVLRGSC